MIDSVSIPSAAPAPTPGLAAPTSQTGTSAADSAAPVVATKSSAQSTSASTQTPFASTLQSRIKAMALAAANSPLDLQNGLSLKAGNTKAASDDADETQLLPVTADTTSLIPIAANIALPIAAPVPAPSANAGKDQGSLLSSTDTPNRDKLPAGNAAQGNAAILAAATEKPDLPAANSDSAQAEASFAEVLQSTSAHAATAQPHVAAANNASLPVREVHAQVASTHWAGDVGNQLNWMVSQRESRAELVLNPPQLGRIEVAITLNGDQASATFVSPNPEVRDALQGSLPRLREILADAGVFLGQANIGAESFTQNGNGAEKGHKSPNDSFASGAQTLLGSNDKVTSMGTPPIVRGQGMIDLFA